MFQDLFKPTDEAKDKKAIKSAEASLQIVIDRAKRCLSMEEFKSYRDSFERAEDGIMDSLIAYTHHFSLSDEADITKYAMKVSRLITKVETLRMLLINIETKAKRGQNKKGDSENEKHDD